eukprot:CAMPEP_0202858650 /NCGR_PEP_ID=MMETSP1391-20130828/1087_1 /ASSEMBLY_ACC=CAM_ASM_000867 /TAXON_ID=1034604 /ORGANISM="Chlamydomonas leiostraca, Strain SAG 11-49" /LENGTH=145 /DNA_ID=CAMNT_0049537585 /DNA_START=44 /DNA_END=481 /DNA_ORIENTATION=+
MAATTSSQPVQGDGLPRSIFVEEGAEVHDVPISVIRRPIPSVLDENKVCNFVQHIQAGDELTPIEVMWVEHPPGSHYYFATGGCHRWEAHQRLKSETIPARLIKVTPETLNLYMGASSPFYHLGREQASTQQASASAEQATASQQ